MKPAVALKLCPQLFVLALSMQLPSLAAPSKGEPQPQALVAAGSYSPPAKDKYGLPAAQLVHLLNIKDAKAIRSILEKTPRCVGDEDRRRMLEAAILCLSNNFDGALPILSKVKHAEDATPPELFMAAKSFALAQNFKQAIAIATIGANLNNDQKCLEIRAASYSNLNRFDEAIQDFERLARTEPAWASDYLAKEANLLLRTNRFGEGLAVAERAQKANPQDFAPPFAGGLCLVKLGRQREAMQAFTQTIYLAKKQLRSNNGATFFLTNGLRERAKCYRAMGKMQEAEADKAELAAYSDKVMDELLGK